MAPFGKTTLTVLRWFSKECICCDGKVPTIKQLEYERIEIGNFDYEMLSNKTFWPKYIS